MNFCSVHILYPSLLRYLAPAFYATIVFPLWSLKICSFSVLSTSPSKFVSMGKYMEGRAFLKARLLKTAGDSCPFIAGPKRWTKHRAGKVPFGEHSSMKRLSRCAVANSDYLSGSGSWAHFWLLLDTFLHERFALFCFPDQLCRVLLWLVPQRWVFLEDVARINGCLPKSYTKTCFLCEARSCGSKPGVRFGVSSRAKKIAVK